MGEGLLLKPHVCVQVDLGRLGRFVTEPESDHAQVHTVAGVDPWPPSAAGCGASPSCQ